MSYVPFSAIDCLLISTIFVSYFSIVSEQKDKIRLILETILVYLFQTDIVHLTLVELKMVEGRARVLAVSRAAFVSDKIDGWRT